MHDYSGADKESVDVDRAGKPDTESARFELGWTIFLLDWSNSIHGGEDRSLEPALGTWARQQR